MRNEFCMFAFKFLFVFSCIAKACGEKSATSLLVFSIIMGVMFDLINEKERTKESAKDDRNNRKA